MTCFPAKLSVACSMIWNVGQGPGIDSRIRGNIYDSTVFASVVEVILTMKVILGSLLTE